MNLLLLVGLVTGVILLYFQTLLRLQGEWDTNIYYSHGYLMVPLSVWLVWRKWETLSTLPVMPSWAGVPVLLAGLFLFVIGVRAEILFFQGVSLLFVLAGIVYCLAGIKILKACLFPIGLLAYMIPLPYLLLDPIGFPMKQFAASATTGILQAFSVPIVADGVYLFMPNYTLVVEDICNGLRSLISMTMVSTVLAYVLLPNILDRWILVLSSLPIALVANILRILLTAVLGYYVSGELAQGFLHELSGLFVFFASLGGLLLLERVLSWKYQEDTSPSLPAA